MTERRSLRGDYAELKAAGRDVQLPEDIDELRRLALEVIASKGVPSYLTPFGSVTSVAQYVIAREHGINHATGEFPFFNDGLVFLKAALAAGLP